MHLLSISSAFIIVFFRANMNLTSIASLAALFVAAAAVPMAAIHPCELCPLILPDSPQA
jgi:hypothetical protein